MTLEPTSKNFNLEVPSQCYFREAEGFTPNEATLKILLHGHDQTADFMVKQIAPLVSPNQHLLIPTAPFPVPQTRPPGKFGHTWYFYDFRDRSYYWNQTLAINLVKHWLNHFEQRCLESKKSGFGPIRIIGYSQGGYLAPFLGLKLLQVQEVITLNAQFRVDLLPAKLPFKCIAINGEKDEIVDAFGSQMTHQKLIEEGNSGKFILVKNSNHLLDHYMQEELRPLLN